MRNKIDFGIDLGTTNSAIAKMENGVPVIIGAEADKNILPSCVRFTPKKATIVGELAANGMRIDIANTLRTFEKIKMNSFIEFKREMGTAEPHESSNMGRSFSSAELSAEVLKTLKSFVQNENISAIVITIPAKFDNQQREDTMKAAKLAGFKQIQLLQEPVAAATAYGLGSQSKDGFWLVFDFGGGTFDAALIKAEEGILSVKDTEGNNRLGGKNLDYAIVDEIIIPYLKKNYALDSVLNNVNKKQMLREFLKYHAEIAKNQTSFKNKWPISIELGAFPIEDDNGEEIEVDREVTVNDMEIVLSPIFQQAIDITKDLLKRNHLTGSDLDKLILVGGPTRSPILRQMLKEQITKKVDTSVDPMTVVAQGAALYASTIDITDEIQGETRDKTKLQLEVKYDATSVETTALINIRVLKDKSIGRFPAELFVEFARQNKIEWLSGKTKIGEKASLVEVDLLEGCSNPFSINIYDGKGDRIDCEPNQITILQGIGGLDKMQSLSYHICIVKYFPDEEKDLIFPVKGLEKTKPYPVTGVTDGLKTRQTIRPGMTKDIIRIPIYEGDYNAIKSNPELNNLIYEVKITGESLPALLPEGSEVIITIKVDKSGLMKFSAYFPLLDYTEELDIPYNVRKPIEANELAQKIKSAIQSAQEVNATDASARLESLKQQLENEKGNADGRMTILEGLRKELLEIETLEKAKEWPQIEKDLKETYFKLADLIEKIKKNNDFGNMDSKKVDMQMQEFNKKIEAIIKDKNRSEGKNLITEMRSSRLIILINLIPEKYIRDFDRDFTSIRWKNSSKVRSLINQGLTIISLSYDRDKLSDLVIAICREMEFPDTISSTLE